MIQEPKREAKIERKNDNQPNITPPSIESMPQKGKKKITVKK